jgi:hypothetical protein
MLHGTDPRPALYRLKPTHNHQTPGAHLGPHLDSPMATRPGPARPGSGQMSADSRAGTSQTSRAGFGRARCHPARTGIHLRRPVRAAPRRETAVNLKSAGSRARAGQRRPERGSARAFGLEESTRPSASWALGVLRAAAGTGAEEVCTGMLPPILGGRPNWPSSQPAEPDWLKKQKIDCGVRAIN